MSVNCLHPVSMVTKNMCVVQKFFDRDKHPQTRLIKSTHIGNSEKKVGKKRKKQNRGDPTMSAPTLAEAGSCCAGPSALNAESSTRGFIYHPSLSGKKNRTCGKKTSNFEKDFEPP